MAAEHRHPSPPARTRGDARPGRAATFLLALGVAGCSAVASSPPDPDPPPREVEEPESLYDQGIGALEMGDFRGAEDRFRRVAARCESGEEGRSAIVGMVLIHLDLRNPEGRPQEAARLAAIHLNLPGASDAQRALTRTLYLSAVYQGAEPVEGPEDLEPPALDDTGRAHGPPGDSVGADAPPDSTSGVGRPDSTVAVDTLAGHGNPGTYDGLMPATVLEPARRFEQCELPAPMAWNPPPAYPGVPPSRWAAVSDTVVIRSDSASARSTALERRVRELEAELTRIRKLLKGGGGERPQLRP